MAGRITIFIPTILSDWQGSLEDSERGSESSLSDCSSLAWPNMVFSVANYAGGLPNPASSVSRAAVEYGSTASPTVTRGEIVPDRMACLRRSYQMQGLSERVAELLIQSWRNNTNSAYNSAWRKWHRWCVERNYNPFSTSLSSVLQFLAEQFDSGLQYRSVNTLRSAISTTHPNIDGLAVGRHPLVSRLLRGMFNLRPPSPRYSYSWDVRVVVNFLRNYKSADLSNLELAKKTVMLLALVNADRCSDLAALDRDHVRWTASGVEFTVVRLTKTRRSGAPRKVFYSVFRDNSELCPVTILWLYLGRTAQQVADLSSPKPVFLTSRKPFRQARPGTIGYWIKDILHRAGVDTEVFSAHSTRSSSTSWAAAKGVPINDIMQAANWSSQTTFKQFYFCPTNSATYTRTILQSTSTNRYINNYLLIILIVFC